MNFNESFKREAQTFLEKIIRSLEKREWNAGQTESEEVRIAIREVKLAFMELSDKNDA